MGIAPSRALIAVPWGVLVCFSVGVSSAGGQGPGAALDGDPLFTDRALILGLEWMHFNGGTGELYFPEINGSGAALLDFDNDGDLDLYLVQSAILGPGATLADVLTRPPEGQPLCDRLFRNDLEETEGAASQKWVDVTESTGIRACGYGTGVGTGDYDNDGWMDLYVSNFGPGQMWHNNGDGTFSDTTTRTGTADPRWSVPAVFFDYDRDGWLDLFVGNYAGFRLANHKDCNAQAGYRDYCGPKSYDAVPDRLLHNRRDGTFEEVTLASGMAKEYGYALGAVPGDFNGDGWIDLYVANDGVQNQLWLNQGDGTFFNEALLAGCAVNASGQPEASMGVDAGDFDADGDTDVVVTNDNGPVQLLINNVGHRRHWLGVSLRDRHGRRDAVGAVVGALRPGRPTLWQTLRTAGSYASANDPRVLLGLGDAGKVSEVRVRWSGGQVVTWDGITPGQYVELLEGSGRAID